MHPPEAFPGHPVPWTKTRLCCVPDPAGHPFNLLMLQMTKRGGRAGSFDDHLAVSIRKHLLPGSVTSCKLLSLLELPFCKTSRTTVRMRWGNKCRHQEPAWTCERHSPGAERKRKKDLLIPCHSPWVSLSLSPHNKTKNSKDNRCVRGGTINH